MPAERSVVFVGAASTPVTGGEIYDRAVIDGLRETWRVDVITPDDIPASARGYPASNRWLIRRHRDRFKRLTIVVDHFWHPRTFLFLWVARTRGARIVCIVHHLYHRLRPSAWQRVVGWLLEAVELAAAHHIVVNSQSTAADVLALGPRRRRITVVRPAVNRIPEPAARGKREPGDPLRLLAVGYVGDRKGLEFSIEAIARATPPFHLTVVGDPTYDRRYRESLDELIDARGLTRQVTFAGRLSDEELDAAYRAADVFVAPALWEGFGMAILDALLFGLPVVATRVGAIPELVDDGVNGFLVPPRDADALRQALERLALDPEERRAMGERSREMGLRLAYGWDHVQDKVRRIVAEA